jgi:hypothetical protein
MDDMTVRMNRTALGWELVILGIGGSGRFQPTYRHDNLPDELRAPIAVLSLLPLPPPPSNVPGLGQRISEDIFWVYLEPHMA